ncbi:MAG: amino acid permease [Bacteroidales bacterium]|nr:amino acid permease [Bacteroidales bacterium]MCK9499735.1 amino acid permease [Bacteroidales bacterium]MDY0314992.1 amino acid permease [Bacteroidales bacterium]
MKNSKTFQKIGLLTAISYVIANMVGTGVFTSLGFQLAGGVTDLAAIMILWLMGGIIAFTGAQVYAELGSVMPRSGGEYHFLSELYHPALGFMSGFFSMFVGFAAPIALASMALGTYFSNVYSGINPKYIAATVIVLVSLVHSISVKSGGVFQNIFTIIKLLLILAFIIAGFVITPEPQNLSIIPSSVTWSQVLSSGFAVSLIFVYYSYSGWNASAYFVSELKNPAKNLPRSLIVGTLVVTVLYLFVNYIFLYVSPISSLNGQLDIGAVAAGDIFGRKGGIIMSGLISLLLISTISSMIFAGPRVIQVIGEDYSAFSFIKRKRKNGVPLIAILIQSSISLILLFTSTFEQLLTYLGFVMNIFAFLTVAGVFIHRKKYPNIERPFKTKGYPIIPMIFMAFIIWNMIFMFKEKTVETLIGLATLLVGLAFYYIAKALALEVNES